MINRLLIRIKVLQILYTYYHNTAMTADGAVSTLRYALQKVYDEYRMLCLLPLNIAYRAMLRREVEAGKIRPDEKVLWRLNKLQDSALVRFLTTDERAEELADAAEKDFGIGEYVAEVTFALSKDEALDAIDADDLQGLKEYWKGIFKTYFTSSSDFREIIEGASIYLNDDIDVVYTFVNKFINAISSGKSYAQILRPPYSKQDEADFGPKLLSEAIRHKEEYRDMISEYFKNWDRDRVGEMDFIILQLALTEALHFPLIATRVTINEYLDLARYYSAPNSTTFINGILHELFSRLKSEGRILGE